MNFPTSPTLPPCPWRFSFTISERWAGILFWQNLSEDLWRRGTYSCWRILPCKVMFCYKNCHTIKVHSHAKKNRKSTDKYNFEGLHCPFWKLLWGVFLCLDTSLMDIFYLQFNSLPFLEVFRFLHRHYFPAHLHLSSCSQIFVCAQWLSQLILNVLISIIVLWKPPFTHRAYFVLFHSHFLGLPRWCWW